MLFLCYQSFNLAHHYYIYCTPLLQHNYSITTELRDKLGSCDQQPVIWNASFSVLGTLKRELMLKEFIRCSASKLS
jgi:hypothetical protein